MESSALPHRCPACQALVVDRRSPVCTTCRAALPKEWVMTREQTAKMMELDREARAEHVASMRYLDPRTDPNVPAVVKLLDTNWGMGI